MYLASVFTLWQPTSGLCHGILSLLPGSTHQVIMKAYQITIAATCLTAAIAFHLIFPCRRAFRPDQRDQTLHTTRAALFSEQNSLESKSPCACIWVQHRDLSSCKLFSCLPDPSYKTACESYMIQGLPLLPQPSQWTSRATYLLRNSSPLAHNDSGLIITLQPCFPNIARLTIGIPRRSIPPSPLALVNFGHLCQWILCQ